MEPLIEPQRADVRVSVAMATILWGTVVAACAAPEHSLTPSTILHLGIGVLTGIVGFFVSRRLFPLAAPYAIVLPTILWGPVMLRGAHVHNGEYWFVGLYLAVIVAGALYRRRSLKSSGSQTR